MKKLILICLLALLSASGLFAAVIACPSNSTLDVYVSSFNGLSNACFSQDKIFYNFTYSPLPGTTSASGVQVSPIFQQFGGIDIHGFNFNDNWTSIGAGFTLGYTIQMCTDPACLANVVPGTVITAADATFAPTFNFDGKEVVTWSNGATVTLITGSGALPPLGNIGLGAGTAGPITVNAEMVPGTAGGVTQTSLRFYESAAPVPEPATMVMLGSGILGVIARRKRR